MENDTKTRCRWVPLNDPLYINYHDREWGVPIHDERLLFEFLVLESAQAGLSWLTVLKKRENYREAFDNFDPRKVACYDDIKIDELMQNSGIIRNRRKIEAAVNNAAKFLEIQEEFGSFDRFIWQFVGGEPKINRWKLDNEIPAKTPESDAMSRELKQRGFKFLGSTTCYAHMQATGMVNDHTVDCFRYEEVQTR